jgi:hypothetical protein
LRSTTADVISIRARREAGQILYRIVDKYGTDLEPQRRSSRRPVSLGELVKFIDGSHHPELAGGLALCYNQMNADGGRDHESLRHFSRVRSEVYPQQEERDERVFAAWAEEAE